MNGPLTGITAGLCHRDFFANEKKTTLQGLARAGYQSRRHNLDML
jgi:hypothetical protein